MNDQVNHPSHYQGSIECIDAIEASMSPDAFKGYLKGNAMKYLWRAGKKGNLNDAITDLEKSTWYIKKLGETLVKNCEKI